MLGADLPDETEAPRPLALTRGQANFLEVTQKVPRHPHCPTANVNLSTRLELTSQPVHAFGAVSNVVKSKRFASLLPATHCLTRNFSSLSSLLSYTVCCSSWQL
jgi:hypothetical protein